MFVFALPVRLRPEAPLFPEREVLFPLPELLLLLEEDVPPDREDAAELRFFVVPDAIYTPAKISRSSWNRQKSHKDFRRRTPSKCGLS